MTTKEREIKIFFMFLRKQKCFDEFICNCSFFNPKGRNIGFIKSVLRETAVDEFVYCSFPWLDSQEGFDFWKEVDKNWQHCIQEHTSIKQE